MGSVMEVQVALFCLITAVMSQQPEGLLKQYCIDNSNCTEHSTCSSNSSSSSSSSVCKCNEGYRDDELGKCVPCPGPNDECESCCYPPDTYRCDGSSVKTCVCMRNCRSNSFIFAAQVALGAALILAFLALSALFWKSCQCRNGTRRDLSSLLRDQESSLTSVQRYVLQRLRDRPPRYEDSNQIRLEKPPAYQEAVTDSAVPDIWSTSPPPYSEVLHSSTSSTLTEDNEPVQQANVSMVSDTRTQGKGENRLPDSCQLSRADNIRHTPHEARPTQHSETEMYM